MPLSPEFMFEAQHITEPLKRALNLPDKVWYLILNDRLESAYYMDESFNVHTQPVDPSARFEIERAVRQKTESTPRLMPLPRIERNLVEMRERFI